MRKGNVEAIPMILVVVFGLTIAVLVAQLVLDNIQSATDDSEINQEALNDADNALHIFDLGIIFVNASFFLASFIFVYQIRSSPIFIIPSLLFLGIAVWLSGEVANMYNLFAQTSPITSAANQYPALNLFYNNLATITALLGGVMLVLLYGKTRTGKEVRV